MVEVLTLQFLPLLGSLVVLALGSRKELAKYVTLGFSLATLALGFSLLGKDLTIYLPTGLGVTLIFSLDSLSLITILVLSAAAIFINLYSTKKDALRHTSSFYCLFLLVLFGTIGVAMARDLIQFYVFWEMMLIPAWVLVMQWNEEPLRTKYIGLKFFIITHIGAVLTLSSILWIYSLLGTTNLFLLKDLLLTLPVSTLTIMAALLFMAFIVKMAIFPFQSWLPDAYTSSSMPVTLILVGLMGPIGIYGLARFIPLFPLEALQPLSFPFLVASLVTIFYGGAMALVEKNVKRVLAYSSMSQMGYVLFGFATLIPLGMAGSLFNIPNQVLTKLVLFASLGLIYESAQTWRIDELGGWAKRHPLPAIVSVAAMLSLVGAPPVLGFWPEFFIFSGGFSSANYLLTSLALAGAVLTAAYSLRLIRFVFFGPLRADKEGGLVPISWNNLVALVSFFLLLIVLGLWPAPTYQMIAHALSLLSFPIGG